MNREELAQENQQLHAIVAENQNDIRQIVTSLVSVMNAVGLSPKALIEGDDPMKTIMKSVPSLLTDLTINPQLVELKFAPFKQLSPLLEKYKHLIDEINE